MALPSTDPSDIANAARCFSSCISDPLSVRAYLLDQVSIIAAPPCVTPTAPTLAGLVNGGGDPAFSGDLQASWKQLSNSGTLIIGYIVSWGTTNGGPYTSNSGLLPVTPKTYLITGLNPGTTYYAVVQAVGSVSGCNSVNSNQLSNVPTGGGAPCNSGTTFANTWAANVVANGGAAPSQATLDAIANFQCGLITDGLDTQMIAWNAFAADSLIAARTPQLKGNGGVLWTNNNFVGGDLTVAGLKGDGATKYLQTNGDPIGALTTSASVSQFVYTSSAAASVNGRSFGVLFGELLLVAAKDNTGNAFGGNGGQAANLITTPSQGSGFYCDSRINGADHRLFFGNGANPLAQIGATDLNGNVNPLPGAEYYVFALNNSGAPFGFSAETIGMVGVTKGLTLAQVTSLFARIQTLMTSFGRNV